MKSKILFLGLLVTILFQSQGADAQVTIGSSSTPIEGALLDLKQTDVVDGSPNATKGLAFPRVELMYERELYPIFTGNEADYWTLKRTHTGLVVYNTNFLGWNKEPGLYVWNGDEWIALGRTMIHAKNGLQGDGQLVELGGQLDHSTQIEMSGNTLNFSTEWGGWNGSGAIAINEQNPKAYFHMNTADDKDPIIVNNIKTVDDPANEVDGGNAVYYDLKVSEKGVFRKVKSMARAAVIVDESPFYDLASTLKIANGDADGNLGTDFTWNKGANALGLTEIVLPQDGTYAFSFRLYGTLAGTAQKSGSFYISAFKDSGSGYELFDIAEMVVAYSSQAVASYSINLSVAGKGNDKVKFKISSLSTNEFEWTLSSNTGKKANSTSMFFWKM